MQSLSFLGDILHEPNLWHINRHSVARAFLVGIWFCFIPMPFQMLAAAFFAIWFNANLPLSVVLVWISNPVTMPPMFYFNYKIGAWALDRPVLSFDFELSWSWISGAGKFALTGRCDAPHDSDAVVGLIRLPESGDPAQAA